MDIVLVDIVEGGILTRATAAKHHDVIADLQIRVSFRERNEMLTLTRLCESLAFGISPLILSHLYRVLGATWLKLSWHW